MLMVFNTLKRVFECCFPCPFPSHHLFFSLSSNASNARKKQELTEWKFSTLLELNFLLYIFYFITSSFTLLFTMLKIIILTIFKEKT